MATGWIRHRRAAQAASGRLQYAQGLETSRRSRLGRQVANTFQSVHGLFWVALTGAAWATRMRRKDPDDRGGPVAELAASALLVWRWRSLKDQVAAALQGRYPRTQDEDG